MAELIFTPKQAAAELGVSSAALRRAAAGYEVTFGTLERDARGGRLFTGEALDRLRLALEAVHAGHIASVETALKLIHDDGALPQLQPLTPRAGERADLEIMAADLLAALHLAQAHNVELHQEVGTLRQHLEGLTAAMQGMAADQQDIKRQLEVLTGHAAAQQVTTDGLPAVVRAAVNEALDSERLRVALHSALPEPTPASRRPSWLGRLLRRFET
ncbi:HTH merR-type domain-containing protein [Deinococcus saxicola]|uniref:hypothetical protein n=1 Tax=Deinococcus saxicola TaxID=249406 RepID=UPI0039EEA875